MRGESDIGVGRLTECMARNVVIMMRLMRIELVTAQRGQGDVPALSRQGVGIVRIRVWEVRQVVLVASRSLRRAIVMTLVRMTLMVRVIASGHRIGIIACVGTVRTGSRIPVDTVARRRGRGRVDACIVSGSLATSTSWAERVLTG